MISHLTTEEEKDKLQILGRNFIFSWDQKDGNLCQLATFDGIKWQELLSNSPRTGCSWQLPLIELKVEERKEDFIRLKAIYESYQWQLAADYEVYGRGYLVCTFSIKALVDGAFAEHLTVGLPLAEDAVFAHNHRVYNQENDPASLSFPRALAVDFSTDERPITSSVNFLLESTTQFNNNLARKIYKRFDNYRYMGWELVDRGYFPKDFTYQNRFAISLTSVDNSPNKVRGQRIYHWYGFWPTYPDDEILEEMAEYGCSILAMHMQTFAHISGHVPQDETKLKQMIAKAHALGIKVIFYCQPYLVSIESPDHEQLKASRTESLRIWESGVDNQIVYYEPNTHCDCDELCLRCNDTFDYIYSTVIDCYRKYNFDGLYVDWAWTPQGLCSDLRHNHLPRLFNFYDYLRMVRMWRKAIGPDAIMIGHGGGLLVGSDFVEGYDACLTGEAQGDLDPASIGQQYGLPPTLWAMHRKKEDAFRSASTIEYLVREGMTPHTGIGIMGTSVIATLDPARNTPLLALWQMWRGFPVEQAYFYNYLTNCVVKLDNPEVFYSLHVTPDKQVLLILANGGGPVLSKSPAVGVIAKLNLEKLGLPDTLNCWRMKGNSYETFRIAQIDPVQNGTIIVPELGHHEFIGFVLSPDKPPKELEALIKHLEGRTKRLAKFKKQNLKRLAEYDRLLDYFATLPNASRKIDYENFMKNRITE